MPAHQRPATVLDDELDLTAEYVADLKNLIDLFASVASSHVRAPGLAST